MLSFLVYGMEGRGKKPGSKKEAAREEKVAGRGTGSKDDPFVSDSATRKAAVPYHQRH